MNTFPVSMQLDGQDASATEGRRRRWELIARLAPLGIALAVLFAVNVWGAWARSGARAYVTAESAWAKAQKEAVGRLHRYLVSGVATDFEAFRQRLAVSKAYGRAYDLLTRDPPDARGAEAAFVEAGSHPDDAEPMVGLLLQLKSFPPVQRAWNAWGEGESAMAQLARIGESARDATVRSDMTDASRRRWHDEVDALDDRMARLEERFAAEVGAGARQASNWLLVLNAVASLVLLLVVAVQVHQLIRRGRVAESEARAFGERLDLATVGANDGIWDWHLDAKRLYWTPRVRELLGFPTDATFAEYQVRPNIHAEDSHRVDLVLKQHFAGAVDRLEVDLRLRLRDGSYRWFRAKGMAIRGPDGRAVRVLGTLADIHANVVAEQELRQAWQHSQQVSGELELALNGAEVALWSFEPATGRIIGHKRWDALLGRASMPPTFKGWLDLTHPDDRHARLHLLTEHLENRTDYYESEFRMLHAEGHYVWVRSRGRSVARDGQGRPMRYAGAVMNITAQVAAREVQRRQQDFLRSMIQGVDFGVMITDTSRIIYANAAVASLLEYTAADDLSGLPLATVIPERDRQRDLDARRRVLEGHQVPLRVQRLTTSSGASRKVVMNLSCVDWGGTAHFISTVSPLSRHDELMVHLHAASERLERAMLDDLEAQQTRMARELHDSLGSRLVGVNMLLKAVSGRVKDPQLAPLLEKCNAELKLASETGRRLARGMLPVGEHGGALIDALKLFARDVSASKQVECTFCVDGDFTQLPASIGNHVYRIVQEATTNALRHGQATRVDILMTADTEDLCVSITDDGHGFSEAVLEARTPGIGLKSMRARAKTIHGCVTLRNTRDGGCEVTVTWPRHFAMASDSAPVPA